MHLEVWFALCYTVTVGTGGRLVPERKMSLSVRTEKIMDCIFCKIAAGEIPSTKVFENEKILAFKDLNPQAPVHLLVIPKEHIASADEINGNNAGIVAEIFANIPKIAAEAGLSDGYRIITNIGENGCQSVKHMHFHILGGAKLAERMC